MSMNKLVELLTQNIIQRGGDGKDKDDEESNGFKGFLYHLFLWKPTIQFGTYIKNFSWIIIFLYLLANIVIYAFVGFLIYLFYYVAFVGYPKWLVDLVSFSMSNVIEIDKLLEDNNLLYNSLHVLASGKSINSKNSSLINAYDVYIHLYEDTGNSLSLKTNVNTLDNLINTNYSQYNEKKYTVALREYYLFYYKLYDKNNVRNLTKTNPDSVARIIDSTNNASDTIQPIVIEGKEYSIKHFQFYKTLTDYKIHNKTFEVRQTTGKGNKSTDQCLWEVYSKDRANNFEEYEMRNSIKNNNIKIKQDLETIYNIINENNYIVYLALPSSQKDIDNFISDYNKYQNDPLIDFEKINEYSWFVIEALNYYKNNNNKNNYAELTKKINPEYINIETLQKQIYNDLINSPIYSGFPENLKTTIKELNTNPDIFDVNLNKIMNILHIYVSREGLYNTTHTKIQENVNINLGKVSTTTGTFNDTGSYLDLLNKVEGTIIKLRHTKAISYYINLSQNERIIVFKNDSFKLNISDDTNNLINTNPIFSHIYFNQNINDDKKINYYNKIMNLYIYIMSGGLPISINEINDSKLSVLINNLSNIGGDYKDFVNSINIANLYFNTYFKDINEMVQKPYTTTESFFYNLWTPFYQDIIMNRIVYAFGRCFKDSWAGNAFVNKQSLEPINYVNYVYKYTFIQDTMTTVVKNTWSRLFTSSTITPPAAPEEVSLET